MIYGLTSGRRALACGALFLAFGAPSALAQTSDDIVLYASSANVVKGAWSVVSDSTAAGGARMANPDAGLAKLAAPMASPVSYFEVPFTVKPGLGYHLWIRSKAQNDSYTNDSVYVQFSGSTNASGNAIDRIGTGSAEMYSLEEATGMGDAGWGWQDNGYGLGVFGPPIYFSGTSQTIRIQAREDGISIDQIVLSPVTYSTFAPGAGKYNATILAANNGTGSGSSSGTESAAGGSSSISWTSAVNARISGATLTKTGGCSTCFDAGAVSSAPVTQVSFTVGAGQALRVGLGYDTSSSTSRYIDYAFNFPGGSSWDIRESDTYRTEGTFSPSDVFTIAVQGTTVTYSRNGSLVYTSKVPSSSALVVDTSLSGIGATTTLVGGSSSGSSSGTSSGSSSGLGSWTSAVNATVSGATLTKTSGCGTCYDAGAISGSAVTQVAFSVPTGQVLRVGLGHDTSSSTSRFIDYSFNFTGGSSWDVRENDVYRADGTFASSDVFTITVSGTTVTYARTDRSSTRARCRRRQRWSSTRACRALAPV